MAQNYNQLRATLAIARGSFKAMLRNPSAVAFSFGFPLVIILVFGFISGGGPATSFALTRQTDTTNYIVKALLKNPIVQLSAVKDTTVMRQDLEKGRIGAIVSFDSAKSSFGFTQYIVHLQSSSASRDKFPILKLALAQVFEKAVEHNAPAAAQPMVVQELPELSGRQYNMIDFILPGMLGFSLLGSAVFGVAFLFFSLRQQLVLKRYYATPISKRNILIGEGLSRVAFQMITAVVIIGIGKFAFNFTLVHGWLTVMEMLVLSLIGLVVFMGFGFVISSLATSESSIPPFANIITLPQMLLGGTFFSSSAFPKWLQAIIEALPLKQLNDAMRNVAFEGAHLTDCWKQLGILAIWGVAIYAVAVRVFKWE